MRLRGRQSWRLSTYRRRDWGEELLELTWIRDLRRAGKRVGGLVGSRGEMISGPEMILKDPERKSTQTMRTQAEATTTETGATSTTEASEDKATGTEETEARVKDREDTAEARGIGEIEAAKGEGTTGEEGTIGADMIVKTGAREGIIGVTGSRGRIVRLGRSQSRWWSRRRRIIDRLVD